MQRVTKEGISYYEFESLAAEGLTHAVFTRRGGSSPPPWDSLNLGGTVGDEPARVSHNRRLAFHSLDRSTETMYDVWQVHGSRVVCAEQPRPLHAPHEQADAILTDSPHVTLFMRFADCVPILLYDPVQKVVGLAHAGWQGTVKRVAAATIRVMQDRYHSQPQDVLAGIGPSIGPHHYPVGPDVVQQVRQVFGDQAGELLHASEQGGETKVKFDLWTANRLVLDAAGVRQVELSGICTACHLDDWFSHRAEAGRTGRFGVLISL